MNFDSLKGKVVVVTGGNKGIGKDPLLYSARKCSSPEEMQGH